MKIKTLAKTFYTQGWDMTVYVEYKENNQISGVNFIMGEAEPCELTEVDDFISDFLHTMWSEAAFDNNNCTDEQIIVYILNMYSTLSLGEWDFKKKHYNIKTV
jgi:hypothetical protein